MCRRSTPLPARSNCGLFGVGDWALTLPGAVLFTAVRGFLRPLVFLERTDYSYGTGLSLVQDRDYVRVLFHVVPESTPDDFRSKGTSGFSSLFEGRVQWLRYTAGYSRLLHIPHEGRGDNID